MIWIDGITYYDHLKGPDGVHIHLFGEEHIDMKEHKCQEKSVQVDKFYTQVLDNAEETIDFFLEDIDADGGYDDVEKSVHHLRNLFHEYGYGNIEKQKRTYKNHRLHWTDIRDDLDLKFLRNKSTTIEDCKRILFDICFSKIISREQHQYRFAPRSDLRGDILELIKTTIHPIVEPFLVNGEAVNTYKLLRRWADYIQSEYEKFYITKAMKKIKTKRIREKIQEYYQDRLRQVDICLQEKAKDMTAYASVLGATDLDEIDDETLKQFLDDAWALSYRPCRNNGDIEDNLLSLYFRSIFMDVYTICRMMKKFKVPSGGTDPFYAETIIYHSGELHSTRLSGFFQDYLGYDIVSKARQQDGNAMCVLVDFDLR